MGKPLRFKPISFQNPKRTKTVGGKSDEAIEQLGSLGSPKVSGGRKANEA